MEGNRNTIDKSESSEPRQAIKVKSIFNRELKAYKNWFVRTVFFWKIVVYDETLPDPKNVEGFNELLADLSGRRVQELDGDLGSLVKDVRSRIVTKDTPTQAVSSRHDHKSTTDDLDVYTGGLAYAAFILALPILVLLWIFFRWR